MAKRWASSLDRTSVGPAQLHEQFAPPTDQFIPRFKMVSLRMFLLAVLLLETTAQVFDTSSVHPNTAVPAIPTKKTLTEELSSWQTIQVFNALLQSFRFPYPQNASLVLAPTNAAFMKFLSRLAPPLDSPFSAAAAITATLDKLISTGSLYRILGYHIIPGDFVETDLNGRLPTTYGELISFDRFPNITDVDPVSEPRRLYRQIKAIGGSFMFVSEVLLPLNVNDLFPDTSAEGQGPVNGKPEFPRMGSNDTIPAMNNETFPVMSRNDTILGMFANGSLPNMYPNNTSDSPLYPSERDGPDFFSMILAALSPALSQDPFVSNSFLISSRTDLQIMNALLRLLPELSRAVMESPTHILAPTDEAFIDLFMTIGAKFDVPELSIPDISDPGFLGNLTELLKVASAAESIWSSVAGLPGLAQVVAYHIMPTASNYSTLVESSGSSFPTLMPNQSLKLEPDAIIDADRSRRDPMPIASFITESGHVTIIDGVLTPLDTSVAGEVLDGALKSPSPSPSGAKEDDDRPACFPSDGVVYMKHGVARMSDLIGGDEIRVDDTVERHSAVFMFTHRNLGGIYKFVKLSTAAGYSVTLTAGHYVHSQKSLIAAGSIRVGDTLQTVAGESPVTKVQSVWRKGLVAPHTVDGKLIVDGVLVSGYSQAVHPWIAHALLMPVRWFVKLSGSVEPFGGMFYGGGKGWEKMLPVGGVEYEGI